MLLKFFLLMLQRFKGPSGIVGIVFHTFGKDTDLKGVLAEIKQGINLPNYQIFLG